MSATEIRVTVSGDDNLRSTTGNMFRTRLQERRSSTRSHLSLPLTVHSASWSAASTPSAPTTPTLVHPALILLKVRRESFRPRSSFISDRPQVHRNALECCCVRGCLHDNARWSSTHPVDALVAFSFQNADRIDRFPVLPAICRQA